MKASIQRFDADGSNQSTFASGLRNPTTLAFNPSTGDLYTAVQERDGLGDRVVPDFMTRVQQGAFYGWPHAYIGQHPQPGFAQLRPDKVKASAQPDLLFEAHSSAMDIVFYEGEQFPAEYKGDAFVALKGSWNRSEPIGYKVVRVPFKDGKPQGYYQNFVTGFWVSGQHRAEVWGRPARAGSHQGRRVADRRRHRRHDLAHRLQRTEGADRTACRYDRQPSELTGLLARPTCDERCQLPAVFVFEDGQVSTKDSMRRQCRDGYGPAAQNRYACEATWAEINLAEQTWTIQAHA